MTMHNTVFNLIEVYLLEIEKYFEFNNRKIDIVKTYYGINENTSLTLENTGKKFEITKERVRQIINEFNVLSNKYIKEDGAWLLPFIQDANIFIKRHIPLKEDKLKILLREIGILSNEVHSICWLYKQKDLFGIDNRFHTEMLNKSIFVIPLIYSVVNNLPPYANKILIGAEHIDNNKKLQLKNITNEDMNNYIEKGFITPSQPAKVLRGLIIKEIVKNGCLNEKEHVHELWSRMEEQTEIFNTPTNVKKSFFDDVAKSCKGYQYIGDGWFWLKGIGRNKLINNIYKLVSVLEEIEINELSERILVSTDIEMIPKEHVIARMLEDDNNIIVTEKDNRFYLQNKELDPKKILKGNEYKMTEILKENGQCLSHKDFARMCLQQGITNYQFCVKLNYSPLFRKIERGLYCL